MAMFDADSSLLDPPPPRVPSDAHIARALRDVVEQTFKANDLDNLTLKRVRAAVTTKLGLPDGFLKSDPKWGDKSKAIVNEEVAKHEEKPSKASAESVKPQAKGNPEEDSPVQKPSARTQKPPSQSREAPAKSQKRKSPDSSVGRHPPTKRKKSALGSDEDSDEVRHGSDDDDSDDAFGEVEAKVAKPQASQHSAPPTKTSPANKVASSKPQSNTLDDLGPESELSDVLDDAPAAKPRAKRSKEEKSTKQSGSKATKKAKTKTDKQQTPQDEEIKRLQGQLAKCGIRKLWGKELAKFDSARDKISHLKGLLRDVGIDGRFSEEKARQIKEARELKADVEAIQEGDKSWGTKEEVPRRRLARGLQEIQGLFDDEESD